MRELSPWAKKSQGRDRHRAFYARYITSPEWYRRRDEWAETESARIEPAPLRCLGGCGELWSVRRGDLHHCTYDRLGHESHEDLWQLCRTCHTELHRLLDSTKSWRKLDAMVANRLALATIQSCSSVAEMQDGSLQRYL